MTMPVRDKNGKFISKKKLAEMAEPQEEEVQEQEEVQETPPIQREAKPVKSNKVKFDFKDERERAELADNKETKHVTFLVNRDLAKRFKLACHRTGMKQGWVFQTAMEQFISEVGDIS